MFLDLFVAPGDSRVNSQIEDGEHKNKKKKSEAFHTRIRKLHPVANIPHFSESVLFRKRFVNNAGREEYTVATGASFYAAAIKNRKNGVSFENYRLILFRAEAVPILMCGSRWHAGTGHPY